VHRRSSATRWFATLALASSAAACASTSSSGSGGTARTAATSHLAPTASNGNGGIVPPWLWPFSQPNGPDAQRAKMEEAAGPGRFRNEALTDARGEMVAEREAFQEKRAGFVSSEFAASRNRFRGGRAVPTTGPVVGPAVQDPDLVRALLAAAALGRGGPLTLPQPVLARLLPAFNY
jgi:hypothetical protein